VYVGPINLLSFLFVVLVVLVVVLFAGNEQRVFARRHCIYNGRERAERIWRELGTEEGKRARRWKSKEDARRRGQREAGWANGWGCDEEREEARAGGERRGLDKSDRRGREGG
jgi:hypothetical protein